MKDERFGRFIKHRYIHTYILYLSCRSVKKAAKELMWTYKLKSMYKKVTNNINKTNELFTMSKEK